MHWYCIQTRPRREAQTASFLDARLGLEVYFPRLKRRKTIRRVWREVVSPLFPRYLFCRFDSGVHFRSVSYAADVTGVVSRGRQPATVSDELIAELRNWAGAELDLISADEDFRVGEQVQVVAGPMQGLRAVILHARDDQQRVAVLLSLLESPVRMFIERTNIAKCT